MHRLLNQMLKLAIPSPPRCPQGTTTEITSQEAPHDDRPHCFEPAEDPR